MVALHPRHQTYARSGRSGHADEAGALGGWQTVAGVLGVALFVALPTGLPLSEVLARWVPALHTLQGLSLTLVVTAAIWVALVVWLLQGVHAYLAHAARA